MKLSKVVKNKKCAPKFFEIFRSFNTSFKTNYELKMQSEVCKNILGIWL